MENFWNKLYQTSQLILLSIIGTKCDISCNFNYGDLCQGWTIEHNNTICAANWTIWKGPTQTSNTGPSGDRLNKNGYFIYMETTNQKHKDIAIFYSPMLQSVNVLVNTSFWYHMHGMFIQSLKIYLHVLGSNNPKLIKKIEGEHGNQWNLGTVYFEESNPFKLAFQAMVGSTSSDIAVDDISITGAVDYDPNSQTTITALHSSDSTESGIIKNSFIPVPYIIICSVGGFLWLIIIMMICWCVYKANTLRRTKQDVACNTAPVEINEVDKNMNDKERVCFEDIELVLNAGNLEKENKNPEIYQLDTKF